MITALASALEFLRCARANVADAAAELELTGRHDAALLAQRCDAIEQDLRALESALTASAAVAPSLHPMPLAGRGGGHLFTDEHGRANLLPRESLEYDELLEIQRRRAADLTPPQLDQVRAMLRDAAADRPIVCGPERIDILRGILAAHGATP